MKPKDGTDKEFLSEAEELLETLGRDLLRYEEVMLAGGKLNPDILNGIFRAAHSLKGLAGMFGRQEMSALAHSMESLLDRMRLGKVPRDPQVLDVLFDAVDKIKAMLAASDPGSINTDRTLARLADAAEGKFEAKQPAEAAQPDQSRRPAEEPEASREAHKDKDENVLLEGVAIPRNVMDVLTEYEEFRLLENIRSDSHIIKVGSSFDIATFDTELPELMNWLKERGEVITTLPGGEVAGDDRIHFDLLVGTEENLDTIRNLLKERGFAFAVIKQGVRASPPDVTPSHPQADTPLPPEEIHALTEETAGDEDLESARSVSRTVRVDIKRLDNLMNIVGELVLEKTIIGNIRDQLRQEKGLRVLANDLYKAHRNLDRKLVEMQEAVMEVRMVPVGQLFGRLGRIVRKMAREENKEIELVRTGSETELDKLIIEELADPLMHIIRNAIDHGVESPGMRERRGKPRKGTIELKAFQQGNHVVIQVHDNGAGIDTKRVHNKAMKMGLIEPGMEFKEEDIWPILFEPGFTTKEEISEISGRGVGLDVVRRNIANLSGMIDIESEVGVGTTFTITLPITLAIIQALIVEVAGRTYAMPLNSVRECHIITSADIRTIEQREVMELRERTIPLLRLDILFGHNGGGASVIAGETGNAANGIEPKETVIASENGDKKFVVVVGIAEKRLGVLVDKLKGRQDVVIKSLGKTLGDIKGVAGATDLGNQQTVLILDVGDLISEVSQGPVKTVSITGRF